MKHKILQFLKFLFFSLSAGIIEFGSFTLFSFIFHYENGLIWAEIVSVVLSSIFNFTLNRKYTFKTLDNLFVGMLVYGIFHLLTITPGVLLILVFTQHGMNKLVAKAIKMLILFFADFIFCKFFLFKFLTKSKKNSTYQNQ